MAGLVLRVRTRGVRAIARLARFRVDTEKVKNLEFSPYPFTSSCGELGIGVEAARGQVLEARDPIRANVCRIQVVLVHMASPFECSIGARGRCSRTRSITLAARSWP